MSRTTRKPHPYEYEWAKQPWEWQWLKSHGMYQRVRSQQDIEASLKKVCRDSYKGYYRRKTHSWYNIVHRKRRSQERVNNRKALLDYEYEYDVSSSTAALKGIAWSIW